MEPMPHPPRGSRALAGPSAPAARQPKLLEQVRIACRARQFSDRTAEAHTGWIRRYVLYHGFGSRTSPSTAAR